MQQECTTEIYRLLGWTVWKLWLQGQWYFYTIGEYSWHWRACHRLPGIVVYLVLQSHSLTTQINCRVTRLFCCIRLLQAAPVPELLHACASAACAPPALCYSRHWFLRKLCSQPPYFHLRLLLTFTSSGVGLSLLPHLCHAYESVNQNCGVVKWLYNDVFSNT